MWWRSDYASWQAWIACSMAAWLQHCRSARSLAVASWVSGQPSQPTALNRSDKNVSMHELQSDIYSYQTSWSARHAHESRSLQSQTSGTFVESCLLRTPLFGLLLLSSPPLLANLLLAFPKLPASKLLQLMHWQCGYYRLSTHTRAHSAKHISCFVLSGTGTAQPTLQPQQHSASL